jgi:hypothetical protein
MRNSRIKYARAPFAPQAASFYQKYSITYAIAPDTGAAEL